MEGQNKDGGPFRAILKRSRRRDNAKTGQRAIIVLMFGPRNEALGARKNATRRVSRIAERAKRASCRRLAVARAQLSSFFFSLRFLFFFFTSFRYCSRGSISPHRGSGLRRSDMRFFRGRGEGTEKGHRPRNICRAKGSEDEEGINCTSKRGQA